MVIPATAAAELGFTERVRSGIGSQVAARLLIESGRELEALGEADLDALAEAGRATPAEFAQRAGFQPQLLEPGFRIPEKLPRRGRIEFIRLIRSDRLLNVLGEQIVLGPDVVHEYVTAILHLRRGEIEVVHGGRTVKRLDFVLRS